jgi:hypothetical protein
MDNRQQFILLFLTTLMVSGCGYKDCEPSSPLQEEAYSISLKYVNEYEFAERLTILAADNSGNIVANTTIANQNSGKSPKQHLIGSLMFPILLATFDTLDLDITLPVGVDSINGCLVVDDLIAISNDTIAERLSIRDALAVGSKVAFCHLGFDKYSDSKSLKRQLQRKIPEVKWASIIPDKSIIDICSGNLELSIQDILTMLQSIQKSEIADSVFKYASAKNGIGFTIAGMTSINILEKMNSVEAIFVGYSKDYTFVIIANNIRSHPSFLIEIAQDLFSSE